MFDQKFLTQKLDKFVALLGINSVVEYDFREEGENLVLKVSFRGDNLGYAIGNRGRNIESMQYILSVMLRKMLKEEKGVKDEELAKLKLSVDIGDYREASIYKLHKMLDSRVDDVRTLGEYIDLPPMSSADRREVHLYLEDYDDVKTESHGEGRDRAVRILPASEDDLDFNFEEEEDEQE